MREITQQQEKALAIKIAEGIYLDAIDEGVNSLEVEIKAGDVILIINVDINCEHIVEFRGSYTQPAEGKIYKTLQKDSMNVQVWDDRGDDYYFNDELYDLIITNIEII